MAEKWQVVGVNGKKDKRNGSNSRTPSRSPPTLYKACAGGNVHKVTNISANASPAEIQSGLVVACQKGRCDVVLMLMPQVDLKTQIKAFYETCKHGRANIINALVARPEYQQLIKDKKYQGLIFAVLNQRIDAAKAIPYPVDSELRAHAISRALSIMFNERNFNGILWMVQNRNIDHQGICVTAGTVAGYYAAYGDVEMACAFIPYFNDDDDKIVAMHGVLQRTNVSIPFHYWALLFGFTSIDDYKKILRYEFIYKHDLQYMICGLDEPEIHAVMQMLHPEVRQCHLAWLSMYVNSLPSGVFDDLQASTVAIDWMIDRFGADNINNVIKSMRDPQPFINIVDNITDKLRKVTE